METPTSPLFTATHARIDGLLFDVIHISEGDKKSLFFTHTVNEGLVYEITPDMDSFRMTPDGVWHFRDDDGDDTSATLLFLSEADPSDVQDRITADLRAAQKQGGMPAVKELLRLAVAAFACEPLSDDNPLPEPDQGVLEELAEAILTPTYQHQNPE